MSDLWQLAVLAAVSCTGTVTLVPMVRRLALRHGITDKPAEGKVHVAPTPYLGGVAIAVTILAMAPLASGMKAQALTVLFGGLLIASVGLVDDLRNIHPGTRLLVEATAATAAAAAGVQVHIFGGVADLALTVLWLVLVTNSFNLLDNMDGAAGIIATLTALALALAAGLNGQWLVGGLAAVIAGSCLGFLRHNWHPASIFMGDTGSLFLGYLLATTAIELSFPVHHTSSIPAVLLLTAPALFDTTLVVISRVRSGRSIYAGGTDHTSHRLMRLGFGPRAVAGLLALGCGVSSAFGVLVGQGWLPALPVMAFVTLVAGAGLLALLRVPAGSVRATDGSLEETPEQAPGPTGEAVRR